MLMVGTVSRAFVEPALLKRRDALKAPVVMLAPLADLLGAHRVLADAGDPLPPPVLKDVVRAAPKVQDGGDWLFFEVKPALEAKDIARARQSLGSVMQGSYVSPLETDLMIPLEQLISANVDAEEDGWTAAIRQVRVAIDSMKDHVGGSEWNEALENWEQARAAANKIVADINQRGEKVYFVELDGSYPQKRYDAYLQKKKDALAFRNAAGTLALR